METGNKHAAVFCSQRSAAMQRNRELRDLLRCLRVTVQRFLLFLPAQPLRNRNRPYLFQIFCQLAEVRYRRNAVFILQKRSVPLLLPGQRPINQQVGPAGQTLGQRNSPALVTTTSAACISCGIQSVKPRTCRRDCIVSSPAPAPETE